MIHFENFLIDAVSMVERITERFYVCGAL